MRVVEFEDPQSFIARVEGFLLPREAENNLIFGLVAELISGRRFSDTKPLLLAVELGGEVVAAALQTPPHDLVIAFPVAPESVEALVEHLRDREIDLPGVGGTMPGVRVFAEAWCAAAGIPYRAKMAQRIYRATKVISPEGPGGQMRPARKSELGLVAEWVAGFARDARSELHVDELESRAAAESWFRSPERRLFVWEDPEPVSIAGHTGPTPNGIRVGMVFTPAEHRRKGYASALVAALTQKLFAAGRRFCFLYTDLANPTANSIYQQIGYDPVCDCESISFREP